MVYSHGSTVECVCVAGQQHQQEGLCPAICSSTAAWPHLKEKVRGPNRHRAHGLPLFPSRGAMASLETKEGTYIGRGQRGSFNAALSCRDSPGSIDGVNPLILNHLGLCVASDVRVPSHKQSKAKSGLWWKNREKLNEPNGSGWRACCTCLF